MISVPQKKKWNQVGDGHLNNEKWFAWMRMMIVVDNMTHLYLIDCLIRSLVRSLSIEIHLPAHWQFVHACNENLFKNKFVISERFAKNAFAQLTLESLLPSLPFQFH